MVSLRPRRSEGDRWSWTATSLAWAARPIGFDELHALVNALSAPVPGYDAVTGGFAYAPSVAPHEVTPRGRTRPAGRGGDSPAVRRPRGRVNHLAPAPRRAARTASLGTGQIPASSVRSSA